MERYLRTGSKGNKTQVHQRFVFAFFLKFLHPTLKLLDKAMSDCFFDMFLAQKNKGNKTLKGG